MLVVNAGNIDKDYEWIAEHDQARSATSRSVDSSSRYALIAVQGPAAHRASCSRSPASTSAGIKYYWFAHGEVASVRAHRSRAPAIRAKTASRSSCRRIWPSASGRRMLDAGPAAGIVPVRPWRARHAAPRGGDAPVRQRHRRDDDRRSRPIWLDRRLEEERLHRQRRAASSRRPTGLARKLVGFEMTDRGIARHGYTCVHRRAANRRRDQRHADAVSEEGDRHGLCADRADGAGHRVRHRHPRPPRAARGWCRCRSTNESPEADAEHVPYPTDCKYTKDHEWVASTGDTGRVGITDFAQKQLGDVVFVELARGRRTV